MRRIEQVHASAPPQAGVLQQRDANLLVGPAHSVRRDLLGSRLGFSFIHGLLDSPARSALTHFDRHAGLRRGQRRQLAHVRLLFHLDQELTYHITAKEFVIRGAAQRQAMRRVDHLHAVTQGPNTRAERST